MVEECNSGREKCNSGRNGNKKDRVGEREGERENVRINSLRRIHKVIEIKCLQLSRLIDNY